MLEAKDHAHELFFPFGLSRIGLIVDNAADQNIQN